MIASVFPGSRGGRETMSLRPLSGGAGERGEVCKLGAGPEAAL